MLSRREIAVIMISLSMMAGFVTGVIIWNTFRSYEVEQPVAEATLPNPYIDVQLNKPVPPTPTVEPTVEPQLRARLSYYWPPNLGPNCHPDNVVNGECTSWLTDGSGRWHHWSWWHEKYATVACPSEFPLGTKFYIPELKNTYLCIDRGGLIHRLDDGSFRLDLLQREPPWIKGGRIVRDRWSPAGAFLVDVIIVE